MKLKERAQKERKEWSVEGENKCELKKALKESTWQQLRISGYTDLPALRRY
jgi:hypothetical protein